MTFDLDDTLWETGPVIARAEKIANAWLAQHAPELTGGRDEAEMLAHRRAHYATLPHLSHDFTALRRDWLRSLAVDAGYAHEVGDRAFDVFWRARNEVTLFPGAAALLPTLKSRYTLGTITNGNADISHIGLSSLFDFSVTAADAGVMKPHGDIFALALSLADTAAARTVHVGDDPVTDVQGAKAAGMRAVWVNPEDVPWNAGLGPPPDATIPDVSVLPEILARWSD
ncbi:MAG: HAD family hydrolase [Pseudomonadota bacterium]